MVQNLYCSKVVVQKTALTKEVSARQRMANFTSKASRLLPTAEFSQGMLLVTTIIMAIFWNPTFEHYKLVFLLPLFAFEGILFIRYLVNEFKYLKKIVFALWTIGSIPFTPLFMDAISVQLFGTYFLWGIGLAITMIFVRRLFLFGASCINFSLFLLQFGFYKITRSVQRPTAEISQGILLVTTMIAAVFWTTTFEQYKFWTLIPLAAFEIALLAPQIFQKIKAHKEVSADIQTSKIWKIAKASPFYFVWILSTVLLTPFFMDFVSIELFANYFLWGISAFVTIVLLRRLFLFGVDGFHAFLYSLQYGLSKNKEKPAFLSKRRRHFSKIVVLLASYILITGTIFFTFTNFSNGIQASYIRTLKSLGINAIEDVQEKWHDYLGLTMTPDGIKVNRERYYGPYGSNYSEEMMTGLFSKMTIPWRRKILADALKKKEFFQGPHSHPPFEIYIAGKLAEDKVTASLKEARALLHSENESHQRIALPILLDFPDPESVPRLIELFRKKSHDPWTYESDYIQALILNYKVVDPVMRQAILALILDFVSGKIIDQSKNEWHNIMLDIVPAMEALDLPSDSKNYSLFLKTLEETIRNKAKLNDNRYLILFLLNILAYQGTEEAEEVLLSLPKYLPSTYSTVCRFAKAKCRLKRLNSKTNKKIIVTTQENRHWPFFVMAILQTLVGLGMIKELKKWFQKRRNGNNKSTTVPSAVSNTISFTPSVRSSIQITPPQANVGVAL